MSPPDGKILSSEQVIVSIFLDDTPEHQEPSFDGEEEWRSLNDFPQLAVVGSVSVGSELVIDYLPKEVPVKMVRELSSKTVVDSSLVLNILL